LLGSVSDGYFGVVFLLRLRLRLLVVLLLLLLLPLLLGFLFFPSSGNSLAHNLVHCQAGCKIQNTDVLTI